MNIADSRVAKIAKALEDSGLLSVVPTEDRIAVNFGEEDTNGITLVPTSPITIDTEIDIPSARVIYTKEYSVVILVNRAMQKNSAIHSMVFLETLQDWFDTESAKVLLEVPSVLPRLGTYEDTETWQIGSGTLVDIDRSATYATYSINLVVVYKDVFTK